MMRTFAFAVVASCVGTVATAFDLALPDHARVVTDQAVQLGSYRLPVGRWGDTGVPQVVVEGLVHHRSFRIDGESATSLQILVPIRENLREQGFDIAFECDTRDCGGFDFRFGIEVLPAPEMYVNLRDFRFLSARRGKAEAAGVLISGSSDAMFMQVVTVTGIMNADVAPQSQAIPEAAMDKAPPPRPSVRQFDAQLIATGAVELKRLVFGAGAEIPLIQDGQGLGPLARFLVENPQARIRLVGHTDTIETAAEETTDLAQARASAVRDLLRDVHAISPERVDVAGAGSLTPVASNLTEDGRRSNRRVVAVLLALD